MGIPFGGLFTYGDVAQYLGRPGAARAVGNALHSNPLPILIPCHRVLGSNGDLRGYQGGIEAKVYLLRLEGHQIDGNRIIINRDDPSKVFDQVRKRVC
jgi:methylated-DNA-[protein]-cysteine S-methyltransferase